MNRQSGAPMEVPRRARLSRPPARRGRGLCLDPDAAHGARRARRDPRASRSAASASSRPMSAAASGPKARLYPEEIILAALALRARPSGALDRGPQRASADRARIPATIITRSPPMPTGRARSSASMPRSSSMPAPTGCGRKGPTRKPTWRRAPCRAPIRSRTTAPAPTRSRPTRRRSAPIAGSAGPAPASRSSGRSTRSRARSAAIRSRCASRT